MQKLFFFFLLTTFSLYANAQIEMPVKESQSYSGKKLEGYSTTLAFAKAKVEKDWTKYIKSMGKVENQQNFLLLKGSLPLGFAENEVVYSSISGKGEKTSLWIGLDMNNVEDPNRKLKTLETNLKDYIIRLHQNEIQEQIQDSERAAAYTGKNYQKLVKEGTDMEKSLSDAADRIIKLEKEIEDLKKKSEDLKGKIEVNKEQKEKIYQDLESINKVLENNKKKLKDLAEAYPKE
jgi:DNA repair exonuclease SbcCD ATPase subunit